MEPSDAIRAAVQPYSELYMIEHDIQKTFVVGGRVLQPQHIPAPVPAVACVAKGCARCASLKGGYQFRWYSGRWGQEYQNNSRAGAWKPGEAEE